MTLDIDCMVMKDFACSEKPAFLFFLESLFLHLVGKTSRNKSSGCIYMDERAIPLANAVVERIQKAKYKVS